MSEQATCPCGHPVAGHFRGAGCLDNQWRDGESDVFCPCERDGDQAALAGSGDA